MFTLFFINQWQTWLIILLVVLVLFGATRLPALSKSLGQSIKSFRNEMKDDSAGDAAAKAESTASGPAKTDSDKE